jgi:hypothetical protein
MNLDANVASINQAYGGLTARVHDAGYTLERAFRDLEKLIEGDDWKSVGGGYDDINEFLDSVRLDRFRMIADQRKSIVARIKALQPGASNRRIAKAIGVSDMTIGRGLATDVGAGKENPRETKEAKTNSATPVALDGRAAAKLVHRRDERSGRIAAAADKVRRVTGNSRIECRLGNAFEVLADLSGVDAIVCDPPYEKNFLPQFRDLAELADRILKPDGVIAVLCGKMYLPEIYVLLSGFRHYRWTCCYFEPGPSTMSFNVNVRSSWKPLLLYGGCEKHVNDVFRSNIVDAQAGQEMHRWGQDMEAFKRIIEALTEPGEMVVDPFAGGGTTLLAALSTGRNAIGAEIDAACEVFKLEQLTTLDAT